ncbi:MAG: glycerophosphodiester phosphodiesterase [Myxococcales bacterium]|nr:glycerophosphodiester phosphodiesterase [Myxococcales bacterium]
MRIPTVLLLLTLALSGCGSDEPASEPEGPLLLSDHFLNIAHRGGRKLAPEHTLVAYQNGLDVGADILELDVHATSDGVLVLMHDETVDRTTDGSGAIKELSFAELRRLDAAYSFSEDGGKTFPYRGQGIQVPTLEEVFDAHPDTEFVIEIKQETPSIVPEFTRIVRDKGMLERISAGSFHSATVQELRQLMPEVPSAYALGEILDFVSLEDESSYVPPGKVLQVPPEQIGISIINQTTVARARRFDLKMHAWTINDPAQMEELMNLGVDGIITDDPITLDQVRRRLGK